MTKRTTENFFWAVVIFWALLRLALMLSRLWGDISPAAELEALKYFSLSDIALGKSYALWGFWFSLFYGFFYVAVLILGLRLGRFEQLWRKCGDWAGEGLCRQGLLFAFSFFIFIKIISLPSSLYLGFYKETANGFCSLSFCSWLWLYLKTSFINSAVETACSLVFFGSIGIFKKRAHLAVPVIMFVFAAALIILQPLIITPLFYNQKPLSQGALRTRLLSIASKAGLDVKEIYVIDESRYSKHTNAYFSGFGRHKRIVLYDNLINSNTIDETALIFAHEAGHWLHNHVAWGLSLGLAAAFFICCLCKRLWPALSSVLWFSLKSPKEPLCLPFIIIMSITLGLIFSPVEAAISRFMEQQADSESIKLTGLNETFISSQIKLAKSNRTDILPSPFRVFWLNSHPTAMQRIKSADTR